MYLYSGYLLLSFIIFYYLLLSFIIFYYLLLSLLSFIIFHYLLGAKIQATSEIDNKKDIAT